MSWHLWSLFALAYLATTLSPGPNVLLVIRNTLRYGQRATFVTVFGNLLAQLGVMVLVACGIGAMLKTLPPLFIAMKLMGAAYLLWIGARQLLGPASRPVGTTGQENGADYRRTRVLREALFVSGSNPKTMIFLSAFLPQFLTNDKPLLPQFAVMYLTIATTVCLVHAIYAFSARQMQARVRNGRLLNGLRRAGGALFIGLGIKLARLQPV
ncbi:LysE family translocator [Paludibacterium purpuratum]|uniref:Threonine/homoserine/homoserine lactone efflux protein n=1 Tax=Paludibacterium purpuratum TaxID=1144873 RepID=A0A4R7B397_9NEIS|nr:LysE family translocator [Paludibacterium purpuratum]TDR76445.1 threonine/homoserine/homoserine lactone efflux protein [Paludibacterium purpuratum]